MKFLQFKTNINCERCVRYLIPYMEDIDGINYWEVLIDDPDKTLEVEGDFSEEEVIAAVAKGGFDIKKMS